jgi:hypothetical protein
MATNKQYVPKSTARARQTDYGEYISVGFDVAELIKFAEAHKNERGYLNLTIAPRREPSEKATHSVYLDDYKPGQRSGQPARRSAPATPPPAVDSGSDDVPF